MANGWLNDFGGHLRCARCCAGAADAKVNSAVPVSWELAARETNGGGEDREVWEHRKGAGEEGSPERWLEEREGAQHL